MVDPKLINYIQACLARNIPIEQVKKELSVKGWKDSDVAEAIRLASQSQKQIPKQPVRKFSNQPARQIQPSQKKFIKQPVRQFQPQRISQRPVQMTQKPMQPETGNKFKLSKKLIFIIAGAFVLVLAGIILFFVMRGSSAISDAELSEGTSLVTGANKEIKFNLNDAEHTLTVNSVSANSVSITIMSTPMSATLSIGETKKFDFEDDKVYDLSVKLNNVIEGEADMYLKKISEVCVEEWQCTEWSNCTDGIQTRVCEDLNDCGAEENKPDESQECEVLLGCSEQGGFLCSGTETCNGTISNSTEGDCCLGECIESEAIACGTNLDCMITASETCSPANLTYSFTITNTTWTEDDTYYYEIMGLVNDKCRFYQKLTDALGNFTESQWTTLWVTNTTGEISQMIDDINSGLKVGDAGTCNFSTSTSLNEYLILIRDENHILTSSEISQHECTGDLFA